MLKKHRLTILFGLLSLLSFMLWGISAMPKIARAVDYAAQSGSQRITLSGVLNIIRGDPPPDSNLPHQDFAILQRDDGRITQLAVEVNTLLPLRGKHVQVIGVTSPMIDGALQGIASESFYVEVVHEIALAGQTSLEGAQDVTGSRPWVTLLCRFGDSTHITPHEPEWYQELFMNSWGGIDHYWQQISYGIANIDDPNLPNYNVKGWYNLPRPRSYYMASVTTPDWGNIIDDCTAAANADVYFPDYAGINLMLNADIGCCAWGGGWFLNIDGQSKNYSATWVPPMSGILSVMTHEMGHGFGLPHSSGPYGQVYDSRWDIMSSSGGTCTHWRPGYGCLGVGTIAYHLDMLGWISGSRKLVVSPGSQAVLTLERLRKPLSSTNYLMAQIPIDGSDERFYTVEARKFGSPENYDLLIPGEAVVIHNVNVYRNEPAHVVDATVNNDPNDDGAQWTAGETFTDPTNQIRISVLASSPSSFDVFISNGRVSLIAPAHESKTDPMPVFSWTPMAGATSYELQVAASPTFSGGTMTLNNLTIGTYTPAPMGDGEYFWRVRAMTGTVGGNWSAIRTFTITTPPPSLMFYTVKTPKLTWGRVTWAAGYEIQIDDNSDFSSPIPTAPTDANTLEYTAPALSNGTYYWRVRALPNGAWSAAQRFEVIAP